MLKVTAFSDRIPGLSKTISQNEDTWCRVLGSITTSNTIQPREYSKGGGRDGFWYENASRGERELERRRLEHECQLR